MKQVCVVGLGESGLSMVKWAIAAGSACRVVDTRDEPPMLSTLKSLFPDVPFRSGALDDAAMFDGCDRILVSPGVSLAEPALLKAKSAGIPIVGDIQIFSELIDKDAALGHPRPKIVAITGSNGKSTVTTLVGKMAEAAGLETRVAGNISPSALDALGKARAQGVRPAVWVLELSSFQLETTESLNPDVAVILNVSEDHLDRYDSMADYVAAKQHVFRGARTAVVNLDESTSLAPEKIERIEYGLSEPTSDRFGVRAVGGRTWLSRGETLWMPVDAMALSGRHNVSNLLAAFALGQAIGLPIGAMIEVGRTFAGLPHRVERIAEIQGVRFIDDSKGTNVGATVAAIAGESSPAVLIAGGDGKGQDFSPLKPALEQRGRAVVLIGRDAGIIAEALKGLDLPIERADTMAAAVEKAYALAQTGDRVLLSPACASFDMFDDYAHRAQTFIDAVKTLERRVGGSG